MVPFVHFHLLPSPKETPRKILLRAMSKSSLTLSLLELGRSSSLDVRAPGSQASSIRRRNHTTGCAHSPARRWHITAYLSLQVMWTVPIINLLLCVSVRPMGAVSLENPGWYTWDSITYPFARHEVGSAERKRRKNPFRKMSISLTWRIFNRSKGERLPLLLFSFYGWISASKLKIWSFYYRILRFSVWQTFP